MLVLERRASTVIFNLVRGIRRPGRFLLPANICPIVPLVFLKAGRPFEFVDVSPSTLCMNLDEVLRIVRQSTRDIAGVVFVRTYGALRDVDAELAEIKNLDSRIVVFDDRCLCPPRHLESPSGVSDAILYSTGHAKFADIGFGGFGVIRSEIGYSRCSLGFSDEALVKLTSDYKSAIERGDPFVYCDSNWLETGPSVIDEDEYWSQVVQATEQAAVQKERLNLIYQDALPAGCQLPAEFQNWRFNVIVKDKRRLMTDIFDAGLFASSHYAVLSGIFAGGQAPVAARLHGRVVNLFNDRYFDEDKAARVASIVRRHVGSGLAGLSLQ